MAPSATSDIVVPETKVEVAKQPEKHVHGAEDKSPLEAISHGPLIHPGKNFLSFLSQPFCVTSHLGMKKQCREDCCFHGIVFVSLETLA